MKIMKKIMKKILSLLLVILISVFTHSACIAAYSSAKYVKSIDANGVIGFSPDGKYYIKEAFDKGKTIIKIQLYSVETNKLEKSIEYKNSNNWKSSSIGTYYNMNWNDAGDKFLFTAPAGREFALNFINTGIYLCDTAKRNIINIIPEKKNVTYTFPVWLSEHEILYYCSDFTFSDNSIKSSIYKYDLITKKSELIVDLDLLVPVEMFHSNGNIFWNDGKKLYRMELKTNNIKEIYQAKNELTITDVRKNGFVLLEYQQSNRDLSSCPSDIVTVFKYNSKGNSYEQKKINFNTNGRLGIGNACLSPDETVLLCSYAIITETMNLPYIKILNDKKSIEIYNSNLMCPDLGYRPQWSPYNNHINGMYWLKDKIFIRIGCEEIKVYKLS